MSNFNTQTKNVFDNAGRVWSYRAIEKKERLNEWKPISEQDWNNFVEGALKAESLLTPKNIAIFTVLILGAIYLMYLLASA
ncbi:hypothetical protein [uncultured Psychrobacter sp.]|uniref:hypothetical protein n=1 Tax=uncultured Psychrobacter sp. TaxID=259303 RepID=UPI0030D84EC5